MSSTSFTVNTDSLATFASNLANLGPVMESLKSINNFDASSLGGPTMQSAIEGFAKTWSYGAGKLEDHVKTMTHNAEQAAENYEKADECVLKAEAKIKI